MAGLGLGPGLKIFLVTRSTVGGIFQRGLRHRAVAEGWEVKTFPKRRDNMPRKRRGEIGITWWLGIFIHVFPLSEN
jgi:hypothetical protein